MSDTGLGADDAVRVAPMLDPQPRPSLRLRWIQVRNALLQDRRFQAFAAAFPFTRGVAAQRAQALFDVVAGFVYSQIAHACVASGALEAVRAGPLTRDAFARRVGLPRAGADRLIDGAHALGLLERVGADVALGAQGAALLGNPGVAEMILHHDRLYSDLADPLALLRRAGNGVEDNRSPGAGGALSDYWGYAGVADPAALAPEAVAPYSRLMAASQPIVAAQALDTAPLGDRTVLMDVGGGEGAFIEAAARRWPHLSFILFDLPAVTERARARLGAAGVLDRVRLVGGDFQKDPLPTGADVISFVRVLHDHNDDVVMRLLASARAVLPVNGKVLVVEPMAGRSPVGDAYFGFYLAAMGTGRPRTPENLTQFLRASGFLHTQRLRVRLPMIADAIMASI